MFRTSGPNLSQILIKPLRLSFKKMHLKMLSQLQTFCSDLTVLSVNKYSCYWPGNIGSQGISQHSIFLIWSKFTSTRMHERLTLFVMNLSYQAYKYGYISLSSLNTEMAQVVSSQQARSYLSICYTLNIMHADDLATQVAWASAAMILT